MHKQNCFYNNYENKNAVVAFKHGALNDAQQYKIDTDL